MRVAYLSDIHADISRRNWGVIDLLIDALREVDPDVFVICGDISHRLDDIEYAFRKLEEMKSLKIFVSGNHDIWISKTKQKKGYNSYVKYYRDIKGICEKHNVTYLAKEPAIISDVAFVGTMGWYDYSLRNEALDDLIPMSSYRAKKSIYGYWNDAKWAYWPLDLNIENRDWRIRRLCLRMSDEKVTNMLCQDLAEQIRLVKGKVKQIIAVTHMVPFKELIEYTGDPSIDFFYAFAGSTKIGEILKACKLVTHVIYGHIHKQSSAEIHSINCYSSPIGYLDDFEGDLLDYVYKTLGYFSL